MNEQQVKEYVKGLRENLAEWLWDKFILNIEEQRLYITAPNPYWKELKEECPAGKGVKEAYKVATQLLTEVLGDLEIPIGEVAWRYETCKCCTREQRLAWYVPDEIWDSVVIDYYRTKVLCLECFLRMADDRGVDINEENVIKIGAITRDKDGYHQTRKLKEILDEFTT